MTNRLAIPARFMTRYTQREQLLLLLCGLLILLTAGWLLVWQPVMAQRSASEARMAYAVEALDEVNSLAAELEYLRQLNVDSSTMSVAAQSLPQMLDTLSAEVGIVAASLEPASDNRSVGVRFEAVAMRDLLAWLVALESNAGIQVEQLTVAPSGNSGAAGAQSDNSSLARASTVNSTLRVRSMP